LKSWILRCKTGIEADVCGGPHPQGQYWTGRTLPPNNRPPNMAAANFVMAEGCGLNGTAVAAVSIDQ